MINGRGWGGADGGIPPGAGKTRVSAEAFPREGSAGVSRHTSSHSLTHTHNSHAFQAESLILQTRLPSCGKLPALGRPVQASRPYSGEQGRPGPEVARSEPSLAALRRAAGPGSGSGAGAHPQLPPPAGLRCHGRSSPTCPSGIAGNDGSFKLLQIAEVEEDREIINVLKQAANSSGGILSTPATLASSLLVC